MPAAVPYIVSAVVGLLLSFVSTGIQRSLAPKPDSGPVSNGHLVTKRDHQAKVPRVHGRCRVGVNQAYIHTTGGTNKFLHMICAFSEGPIKGIVRQDGSTWETVASAFPVSNPPLVYLDGVLWTEFAAASRHIEFFDGAADQGVCATLQGYHPAWADAQRNTAYLYIRLEYDRERYMSDPGSITVVVDGLECHDPIAGATAWTDNPAIVAYNYMTTSGFRGGMGIPPAVINQQSLSDFKGYCAAKGWTANIPIYEGRPDADNLQAVLDNARARIIPSGGEIKFRYFDLNYESVAMDLTAEDIMVDRDGMEMIEFTQPDIMDRANTVRMKFLNGQDNKFTVDDYVMTDDAAITDDGGDRREQEVSVHGLSDINLVQQMANYHLERARFNRTLSGLFGRRCIGLEPMDLITLTYPPFGWDQKYFRVVTTAPQEDYSAQLSFIEEDDALYDDIYDPGAIEWFDTDLPSPTDVPPSVGNVVYYEETYPERHRSRSRIVVDFDPPPVTESPFWAYAEIWVRRGASGTWEFKTKAGENEVASNYTLDPVEEGETYYIKLVSVSIHGQKEDFATAYTVQHTVLGMNSNPQDISAMTAISNAGGVTLFATWAGDDDVENFEIRIGESWNDGVVVCVAPAHSNDLRATLNGVRPGTHIFWAAALNNAGLYSSTPVGASVTVYVTPGYAELPTYGSWIHNFLDGTFSNCERTTHLFEGVSHGALKCSHTGGVLTGTWQSVTHDLGAFEKVKIWGDFVLDLDSSDKVWTSNWPTGVSWNDLDLGDKTWLTIFSLQQSGKVRARLLVKDVDSDWGSAAVYDFFEMQSVEIEARYTRVEITIIDPNISSNIYIKELQMYAYEGPI